MDELTTTKSVAASHRSQFGQTVEIESVSGEEADEDRDPFARGDADQPDPIDIELYTSTEQFFGTYETSLTPLCGVQHACRLPVLGEVVDSDSILSHTHHNRLVTSLVSPMQYCTQRAFLFLVRTYIICCLPVRVSRTCSTLRHIYDSCRTYFRWIYKLRWLIVMVFITLMGFGAYLAFTIAPPVDVENFFPQSHALTKFVNAEDTRKGPFQLSQTDATTPIDVVLGLQAPFLKQKGISRWVADEHGELIFDGKLHSLFSSSSGRQYVPCKTLILHACVLSSLQLPAR